MSGWVFYSLPLHWESEIYLLILELTLRSLLKKNLIHKSAGFDLHCVVNVLIL